MTRRPPRSLTEVMTSVHVAAWSPLLAERAEAQGRQLSRATWVLAVATVGLMLATIALIVVTATAGS